ncbi:CPBP family intramembrane metalloprotease [Clostridium botulinum]|uniref:CPBP family intramembrane metalloprotease n=1 Tax=Clostridium botulinum TaxID=1491 RepID=A0A6B4PG95_CLOBO|nr:MULTISPECIES: type II CAAX endopeptidase family protein [Clostridium]EES49763.1 caax amino protease family protein [Clostridium botulinum E1 str. 'BoNT E Beluga']MBN1036827.1 CPBP family intramembrane metalloprotease [Clostridium botulinum]MBN1043529.1 CPBP family intramembrane metalloprotease [Clostridium botulinum]MBN1066149.1 CPBP family intramembrane metalloprotease [Clostridium botulinum]MBN1072515.1 CPBP family intramembrane metalloprotease [Clostridium botulinum]
MKKTFRANLYFLIILLGEIVGGQVLGIFYSILGISDIRLILFLNHMILFIIPAIIYVIIVKPNIKQTFKLNKLYLKDFFLIIVLSFVSQPLVSLFSLITSFFFENDIGNFVSEISSTPFLIMLLLMAVMPAITEEITLRGIVQSGYDDKSDLKTCIVIGLLFGIFHLNGQQFLYAAVLGGILAYLVRVTNSIFASMTLHFMINGTSVVMQKMLTFLQDKFGIEEAAQDISIKALSLAEKMSLLKSYIVAGVVSAFLIVLILKKLKKINDKRKQNLINEQIQYKEAEIIDYQYFNKGISYNKEDKIMNWPLIVTIIIYFMYMGLTIMVNLINNQAML